MFGIIGTVLLGVCGAIAWGSDIKTWAIVLWVLAGLSGLWGLTGFMG